MSDPVAQAVLKRSDVAFAKQKANLPGWKEAAEHCLPRKMYIAGTNGDGNDYYIPDSKLQNTTAVGALDDLASGMSNGFMSPSELWFQWAPSEWIENPPASLVEWYNKNTKVTHRVFATSGLYGRAYEFLLDAGCIGTSAMMVEGEKPGSDSPLNFEVWDIGSYAIAENCAGVVDCVWREIKYTVRQAKEKWPDFKPETWANMTTDKELDTTQCFILEIMPRDKQYVEAGRGPLKMPFKGVVVHKETQKIVWEGGWEEFPVLVYRFKRQSSTNPWGVGPGVEAYPDARGVNYLDAKIADGVGKMVDPPMAAKSGNQGTLDLTSDGVTWVENMNDVPKPIFTVGNTQVGEKFLDKKEQQLRGHFYGELFAYFINDDRAKTATETLEIKAEKLGLFAPFGHRFLNEFVDRLLERVFMILLRQLKFGKIPPEAIAGGVFLYPKAVHQSRMALMLQQMARQDLRQLLQDMNPVFTADPTQVDRLNMSKVMELLGAGRITMPGILRTEEEYYAIQQSKQMAAQQQQQREEFANFATKNPDHAAALLGVKNAA